jgi:Flp pilus assembly protein TadG
MSTGTVRRGRRGYVLITTAMSAIALVSMLGVAVDIGRMYITKSEAQNYVDSAAIAAALQLDGSTDGITDARNAAAASGNKWNFNNSNFTNPAIEFSQDGTGGWEAYPNPATGYRFVRVRAQAEAKLLFLPIAVSRDTTTIRARAVAAQVPKTTFREGLFPFSPFAHNLIGPHFGLQPGTKYTLRWPTNPTLGTGHGNNSNVCAGDRVQAIIDLAQAQGGSERGFIEDTSASLIRSTIVSDYQSVFRSVGDIVDMTGGTKQTELDALNTRINQDTDINSQVFSTYNGNGRRIIACPINDGGTPPGTDNRIVGIGAFFLSRTGDYGNGGNQSWCAEYIGPWVQGSRKGGVGNGQNGAFVVRLVE